MMCFRTISNFFRLFSAINTNALLIICLQLNSIISGYEERKKASVLLVKMLKTVEQNKNNYMSANFSFAETLPEQSFTTESHV